MLIRKIHTNARILPVVLIQDLSLSLVTQEKIKSHWPQGSEWQLVKMIPVDMSEKHTCSLQFSHI